MRAFPFSSIISVIISPALVMAPLWAQVQAPSAAAAGADPEALQIHILDSEGKHAEPIISTQQSLHFEVTDGSGTPVSNAAVTCRLPDDGATGNFNDGTQAAVVYTNAQGLATLDGIRWGSVPGPVAIRVTATKDTAHTGILLEMNLAEPSAKPAGAMVAPPMEKTIVAVPVTAAPQPPVAQSPLQQPTGTVATATSGKPAPQPGQIAKTSVVDPSTNNGRPATTDPTVSVTRTAAADAPHSSHAKWYVLAAIAVAAGAGAAFAMKGKSSSSSSNTTSSVSIGNPTISVGH